MLRTVFLLRLLEAEGFHKWQWCVEMRNEEAKTQLQTAVEGTDDGRTTSACNPGSYPRAAFVAKAPSKSIYYYLPTPTP